MSRIIDDITPGLGLPLPNPYNDMDDDVMRLREALKKLDAMTGSMSGGKADRAELAALAESLTRDLEALARKAEATEEELKRMLEEEAKTAADAAKDMARQAQATADAAAARLVAATPAVPGFVPEGGEDGHLFGVADGSYVFDTPAALGVAQNYIYSYSAPAGEGREGQLWFQIENEPDEEEGA